MKEDKEYLIDINDGEEISIVQESQPILYNFIKVSFKLADQFINTLMIIFLVSRIVTLTTFLQNFLIFAIINSLIALMRFFCSSSSNSLRENFFIEFSFSFYLIMFLAVISFVIIDCLNLYYIYRYQFDFLMSNAMNSFNYFCFGTFVLLFGAFMFYFLCEMIYLLYKLKLKIQEIPLDFFQCCLCRLLIAFGIIYSFCFYSFYVYTELFNVFIVISIMFVALFSFIFVLNLSKEVEKNDRYFTFFYLIFKISLVILIMIKLILEIYQEHLQLDTIFNLGFIPKDYYYIETIKNG
ncbi:hypothetical protein TUBRATIS_24950 [Tubulinosema ratisbonensis]|uniref:Transmembrane protein n=1 Tax=Tubulinosema ratisbonensis TaxID=291195 RepID=A0A437AIR1_9MICR|nr:hypothetical protein TUBRATIS_24950 [Tubulinosema ratisbonensis]